MPSCGACVRGSCSSFLECVATQYVVRELAVCLQRSLEDEINRTTIQDLPVFAISYLIVFLYISLALGSYSRWSRVAVRARGTQ